MIDWESNHTRLVLREIESYTKIYARGNRIVRVAYAYRRLRNYIYYGLQQKFSGIFHRPHLNPKQLHVLLHLRGGCDRKGVLRRV